MLFIQPSIRDFRLQAGHSGVFSYPGGKLQPRGNPQCQAPTPWVRSHGWDDRSPHAHRPQHQALEDLITRRGPRNTEPLSFLTLSRTHGQTQSSVAPSQSPLKGVCSDPLSSSAPLGTPSRLGRQLAHGLRLTRLGQSPKSLSAVCEVLKGSLKGWRGFVQVNRLVATGVQ